MYLATTQTLRAKAGTATAVTYTVFGDEVSGSPSADALNVLAQGQLASSTGTLYTVPSSTQTIINEILLQNTTSSPVSGIVFYVNGTAASNQIVQLSLVANGSASYKAGQWTTYDSGGAILAGSGLGTASSRNLGNSVIDPGTTALEIAFPVQAQVSGASKTYTTADLDKYFSRTNSGTAMTDTMPTGTSAVNGMSLIIANDDTTAAITLTAAATQTFVSASGAAGTSTFTLNPGRRTQFVWYNTGGFWRLLTNNNNLTKGKTGTTFTLGNVPKISTYTNGAEIDDSGFPAALAVAGGASGFLSGSDKTKLDNTTGVNSGNQTTSNSDGTIGVASGSTNPVLTRPAITGDVTIGAGSNTSVLAAGSASNLNSGTLPAGRMPALTGDTTSSAGSTANTNVKIQGIPVSATAPLPGQELHYNLPNTQWQGSTNVFNVQDFGADPTANADASLAIYNAIISCGLVTDATKRVLTTVNATTGATFNITVAANSLTAAGTFMAQTTLGPIGFTYTGGGTTTLAATTTWGVTGGTILAGSIIGVAASASGSVSGGYNIGGIVYFPAGLYLVNNEITNSIPGIWFMGAGSNNNHDGGSWPTAGGSWLYYNGPAGGAIMRNVPITGNNGIQGGQALGGVRITGLNAAGAGSSGYGLAGYGFQMISCIGYHMEDLFVYNVMKSAYEFTTVGASMLSEAADCTRGTHTNLKFRLLEGNSTAANISAAGLTNPAATTNLNALSNTTVTVSGAPNATWPATNGYAKFQAIDSLTGTIMWYLVSYTSISGSTLVGCTTLSQWYNQTNATTLNANTPASGNNKPNATMFAGSKIVPAQSPFAEAFTLHGSATANACCSVFNLLVGTYWMGTAIYSGNSDSMTITRPMFNRTTAGTPTGFGVELHGSTLSGATGASGSSRNQFFISGDPGLGGVRAWGIETVSGSTAYAQPASTNRWDYYELGNGAPVPVSGPGCHFIWTPNGGFAVGVQQVSLAAQATAASFTGFITGTTIVVPPQGFQIGTVFKWTIPVSKTAAGTTYSVAVRYGTTNTFASDTTAIATFAVTGTAVADTGQLEIQMVVATLGASATAFAQLFVKHAATITGLATVNGFTGTMATFASTSENPGPAYLNVAITANAANVFTFNAPVTAEVTHAANP